MSLPETSKNPESSTHPVIRLCERLIGFFNNQHDRLKLGQDLHESCETLTTGELRMIHSFKLGRDLGIDLIATSPRTSNATFLISCDPSRFRKWVASLEEVSYFKVGLYGFWILLGDGKWYLRDGNSAKLLHTEGEPYKLVEIFVDGKNVYRVGAPAPIEDNQSSRLLEILG